MLKEKENEDNNKEKEEKEKEKKEEKEENKEKEDEQKEYTKKIGDYILFEQIGQGTFSKVTRAYHVITEQIVAVKILDKEKIEDEVDIERIIREIEILRSISHPNISQMYETYSTVHNFYLMMEFIDGGDLFDYISDNCFLPEQKACYFFRQLISVMEYLSELGISHRDIKPENILLDKEHKNIKVIDFGLSNYCMEHELLHSSCGSPCYASPEMLSGNPYKGITTDLWSAGIVLYSMLVGALPFDDQELHKLYEQIKLGKFYIPSTLSLEAIDLLKRILQVDPKKRITIEELKEHKWFNIEANPMYKGVNIFYEHLPCDTKVVQYVLKNFFREDHEITYYSFIKMVHIHACNKYTATYYLTKKYILKIEDKLIERKPKKIKNKEKENSEKAKENNEEDKDNKNGEKKEKDIIKENIEKKDKKEEKENISKEKKDKKTEPNFTIEEIKESKNEYNYDNDLYDNDKIDEIKNFEIELKNRTNEKEKGNKKDENTDEDKANDKDIDKDNIKDYYFKNNKIKNTRNSQSDKYDNNTHINNINVNNSNSNNLKNDYFFLTIEEGNSNQMNKTDNMNTFLSNDKFVVEHENSKKKNKNHNDKENIQNQKNNNSPSLLTDYIEYPQTKKSKNSNNKKREIINDEQIKKKSKNTKKSENKNWKETNHKLKIGLSLVNIKNIEDKYKICNDSNTERNVSEKYKNPSIINKIYIGNENNTINTIYKKDINKKDKKLKTYLDKIISPKNGDLNFYVINNIINKDKQEKKKNTKNELFNLEIKSNIKKKNIITSNNKENIIVNINNNNYINGNINRNQCQNLSIDNQFFKTNENVGIFGTNSKNKNKSSQIKVNLKSSKGDLRTSNSHKNNDFKKEINKDESKNAQKKLEIEIFSNKLKNLNKFKKRKTPSPFSFIHIKSNNYESSNIMKFNNNYFSNILGKSSNEKGQNIINLSSSQNKSDNTNNTNNTNINIRNNNNYKKKTYKERIKKRIISHKKRKSLYNNFLDPSNIFNYFKGGNKKKRKNNHQRNVSSVLKYQLSDFRTEIKGLNPNSINSNTVTNNDYSSSKNKNTNNKKFNKKESSSNKNKYLDINTNPINNILSYSKEKVISPKIIYQSKNNLHKKRLFLQNNISNNINSFIMDRLKKNKLMIYTGNNNSKIIGRNYHYYGALNQSNSTNNHFLTDNNHKMSKMNSNDKNLVTNNRLENNYISNLSMVLKNGINKNKKKIVMK